MLENEQDKLTYAYFSMEIGLTSKIPTYSGGLGILAGDMLKAAADISFPLIGITLLTSRGYFYQKIKDNRQIEEPSSWSIDDFLQRTDIKVVINIEGEDVTVVCWKHEVEGVKGNKTLVYFLDTNLPENSAKAQNYTGSLYDGGHNCRIIQEIILGVGGVRILKALGYTNIGKYHMNEGHSAFLALELQKELQTIDKVREKCVFTTHTPVPAGHDKFDLSEVEKILEKELYSLLPQEILNEGVLNMTSLALDYSGYINGVALKHAKVSKTMFPTYPINSITNGVHPRTWVSPPFARLYTKYIGPWEGDASYLKTGANIPLDEIWQAHKESKKRVIDFTNANTNSGFDYDIFTIGWARRFTAYKRPEVLFTDKERLLQIAEKVGPIQLIYAGKAHPQDTDGKNLLEMIVSLSEELSGKVKLAYLTNYDIHLSTMLTSGVDAWLNSPMPPYEASGTSGMKCALNGVPHISVLDGWWLEGCIEGETGWSFSTSDELYDLLEKNVIPTFYKNREAWTTIMKKAIMINGSFFNSHRMLAEYIKKAYLPTNGKH